MSVQQKRYSTQLAGEYFVAGELFRQGFFANVSFGNAKSFDILVFSADERKFARIEVKSSKDPYFTKRKPPIYENDHKFHFNIDALSKEIENYKKSNNSNKFYVFVVLNNQHNSKPDFFVFGVNEINKVMSKKIKKQRLKGGKVSGRWDIKLSDIFDSKKYENKDNWDIMRKYLSQA